MATQAITGGVKMNSVAQESLAATTLAIFSGLVVFLLAVAVVSFAIYTLLQTGQSILGELTFTSVGWLWP
jgi:hypothetical protein